MLWRMHVSKVDFTKFEILASSESCSALVDALVLYFDTDLMYLFDFKATTKTHSEKTFNIVVEFRLDLLSVPHW